MNNVERITRVLSFEKIDRLPMIEWAQWWDKTVERWHKQGLSAALKDEWEISDYFGLDSHRQFLLLSRSKDCPAEKSNGAGLVTSEKEYEELKESGHLFSGSYFDANELGKWNDRMEAGESVVWATLEGYFWFPRTLFGIERHLYAFYDLPDLMKKMNQELVEYQIKQLGIFTKIAKPIFVTFAEDLSYNHGPMLSQEQFKEFIAPYYEQIVPELKKLEIKIFMDTDGDVMPVIPWLKNVGIEGVLPLERMAGVDVPKIRRENPEFLMIGGFDKTVMHKGKQAVKAEFDRLLPTMKTGGYIPSVDHQTPPQISLDQYKEYLQIFSEYAKRATS